METRKAKVSISGRKMTGYPTVYPTIEFSDVDDLLKKIDEAIEETEFGKVDVFIEEDESSELSKEEVERLEKEWVLVS